MHNTAIAQKSINMVFNSFPAVAGFLVLGIVWKVPVVQSQMTKEEYACHGIAMGDFPLRCGFSAETVTLRPDDWTCSVSCAAVLLPFLDTCKTCDLVATQGQQRDPYACIVPEEQWEDFGDVATQCSRVMMERYLMWEKTTGCPQKASACKTDEQCRNDVASLFHAYYQSCNYGPCGALATSICQCVLSLDF